MDNSIQRNVDNIQNGANKKASFNFKDVHVFTMPKGGRRSPIKQNNNADDAKKTGFIILIFGFLFLMIILVTAYYYFVMVPASKKTNSDVSSTVDNPVVSKQPAKEEVQKKVVEKKIDTNVVEKKTEKKEIPENSTEINKETEENISEKEDMAEEKATEESDEEKKEFVTMVIIDKDADGLSMEEELAAGTSDTTPDTDNDSYNDLAEMLSGYNPLGEGLIADNANFIKLENKHYHFSFYYPKTFKASVSTDDSFILDLGNQEYFQVFVDKNVDNYDIENWYKKQFGVNMINQELLYKKGDWNIIKNADSKSFFFKNDRDNYIIAYNYSVSNSERYQNIFEIVLNTFKMTQ